MPKTRTIGYAIILFLLLPFSTFAETQEIKDYKVIKGDTLWDISEAELKDPFLWPRVWKENPGIANPHWIYPDQIIRLPLYIIQKEKQEEATALKSTSASQESAFVADPCDKCDKGIGKEITPKPVSACQEPADVKKQRFKGIKGIVLYGGTVIEGRIISMNAETVKICKSDGMVMSYSFEREVANFIRE